MHPEEKIQAHLVSVWRESKMKWWQAITQRQVINFLKSKNTMIHHDGYGEKELSNDLENSKNVQLTFDEIDKISFEEKDWGSVLFLEYEKEGKKENFQYAIAQDWVRYPMKEPTKFLKVDWAPFVQYVKERQKFTK